MNTIFTAFQYKKIKSVFMIKSTHFMFSFDNFFSFRHWFKNIPNITAITDCLTIRPSDCFLKISLRDSCYRMIRIWSMNTWIFIDIFRSHVWTKNIYRYFFLIWFDIYWDISSDIFYIYWINTEYDCALWTIAIRMCVVKISFCWEDNL